MDTNTSHFTLLAQHVQDKKRQVISSLKFLFDFVQDQIAGYRCSCAPGFHGDLCQTERDECSSSPCVRGTCHVSVFNTTLEDLFSFSKVLLFI